MAARPCTLKLKHLGSARGGSSARSHPIRTALLMGSSSKRNAMYVLQRRKACAGVTKEAGAPGRAGRAGWPTCPRLPPRPSQRTHDRQARCGCAGRGLAGHTHDVCWVMPRQPAQWLACFLVPDQQGVNAGGFECRGRGGRQGGTWLHCASGTSREWPTWSWCCSADPPQPRASSSAALGSGWGAPPPAVAPGSHLHGEGRRVRLLDGAGAGGGRGVRGAAERGLGLRLGVWCGVGRGSWWEGQDPAGAAPGAQGGALESQGKGKAGRWEAPLVVASPARLWRLPPSPPGWCHRHERSCTGAVQVVIGEGRVTSLGGGGRHWQMSRVKRPGGHLGVEAWGFKGWGLSGISPSDQTPQQATSAKQRAW